MAETLQKRGVSVKSYKTMLWMDTDGFCTNVWHREPIAYFIKHKLAVFFDNWPQGSSHGREHQDRFQEAFKIGHCVMWNWKMGIWKLLEESISFMLIMATAAVMIGYELDMHTSLLGSRMELMAS
jgi:hypothetical protein